MEEGYFDQLTDVWLKGEGGVEYYAKVACLGGGGNRDANDVECEVVGFGEGRFGADEEELCFVAVEFERVLLHPGFNCREAGVDVGERWVVRGVGAEVDLSVVSIAVEVQVEVTKDLTEGE